MYNPRKSNSFNLKDGLILSIVMILIYHFFIKEDSISYGSGVYAPESPQQIKITQDKKFKFKEYNMNKLFSYNIKAKVLSRKNYDDRFSELSPTDLTLGWRKMSDEKILKDIEISQRGRWYYWKTDRPLETISIGEIQLNSTNTHIIPATKDIESKLKTVIKGNIIQMSGYLVEINKGREFRWKSSTSRTDTGGGSCEVFYVESLEVVKVR